jgi:predicted aspartyl protease
MIDAMGIFRTALGVAPLSAPERRRELDDVMVDTGSEYNWIPTSLLIELGVAPVRIDRFETADGRVLEREVGFALFYAGGRSAAAAVVFAHDGDMVLLGAHGLEGLNLRVDLNRKELVPAGPVPAALLSSRPAILPPIDVGSLRRGAGSGHKQGTVGPSLRSGLRLVVRARPRRGMLRIGLSVSEARQDLNAAEHHPP